MNTPEMFTKGSKWQSATPLKAASGRLTVKGRIGDEFELLNTRPPTLKVTPGDVIVFIDEQNNIFSMSIEMSNTFGVKRIG